MTATGIVLALALFLGSPYIIYKCFIEEHYDPYKLD